jgi:hypothetical protein
MRRTPLTLGVLLLATVLSAAACSGSSSGGGSATSGGGAAEPTPGVGSVPAASAAASAGTASAEDSIAGKAAAGAVSRAELQRAIIRTASLTVRTAKVSDGVAKAETATKAAGGLVGSANVTTDPDHPDQTRAVLELRVPGLTYDGLITSLSGLGQVVHKTEQAEDVTAEVVDVNSRLQTQRKSLDQVRALLSRAGTLSQVLLVERDLTRREAELESLESQRKLLANQTALATIQLTLVTPKAAPPPPPPKRHLGFTTGLIAGWHGLSRTAVVSATALGAALPFLLPVLLLLAVILLLWRRRVRSGPSRPAVADAD